MSERKFDAFAASILIALVVFIVGFFIFFPKGGDGIEISKNYALAYTYKATLKGGTPARVFDFADRNLPRLSVVVPLADERGMTLVRENRNLPPSTVRKVVGRVPTSVVESVTYPGYDYVLWEYHMSVKAPQSVVPEITPRN